MTTNQTNVSTSLLSYFTFLNTAPTYELLKELNGQNPLSQDTLQKVVAYLADHKDAGLEQALKEKIAKTDHSQTLALVRSVCTTSLQTNHLKMLEVCKRIVSLDQLKSGLKIYDPMTIAKRESALIPKTTRSIEKISDTAVQNWHKYSTIFGKTIHWAQTLIVGILTALVTTLLYPMSNPILSFSVIQGYLKSCESIINMLTKLMSSYLGFFATKKAAALAGGVILISVIAINYIHKRFRLGIPEKIDKKEWFTNTSLEAQNGQIKEMKGRQVEKGQVKTAWNVPQGEKFRIALIIAPPGSGKTEFVKGLAWESVNKPDSFVFGKKIFTVNTINLVKEGTTYLNEIFANIKGYEDDIILFFDECHAAGALKGKAAPLIEALKTALLDNNVRAIFATTNKEYEDNLKHNEAFVSRCIEIDFKELPDTESKKILKDKVELDVDRVIEVNPDAYDALLSVASNKPKEGYNPRKVINLYSNVRDYVYSWEPRKLSQKLDQKINKKEDLHARCRTDNDGPDWSSSKEGIELFTNLEKKERKIEKLEKELKTQKSDLNSIARLRNLGPEYRKQYNAVVHQVNDQEKPKEEVLKEFLYLKHILRPALQSTLESEAKKFNETYEEELPLKIDAALIKKLYPATFSSPKDSASNSPRSESPQETTISSIETLSV